MIVEGWLCTPVPFAPFLSSVQLAGRGLRLARRTDRRPFAPSAHPLPRENALDSCQRHTSTRYGRGARLPGDLSWDARPGSLPPLGSYHMSCLVMHEATAGTWPNDQMQLNQLMDLIKGRYMNRLLLQILGFAFQKKPNTACFLKYRKSHLTLMLFHIVKLHSVALHGIGSRGQLWWQKHRSRQAPLLKVLQWSTCVHMG